MAAGHVVEKEAEINFDEAKKVLRLKATMHFKFDQKKANLPVNPTVQMVALVPEEEVIVEETTPKPTEDSDMVSPMKHSQTIRQSQQEIKITNRVACTSEAFSGRCF